MMPVVLGLVLLVAHPLNNLTINQYSGVLIGTDAVTVDYVLDMAEVPTYQVRGDLSDPRAWASATCASVAGAAQLRIDGTTAPLAVTTSTVSLPPGDAGLSTLRLECGFRAPATIDRETTVSYRSAAFADRIGWREMTAAGAGVAVVSSSVPTSSVSGRLAAYPQDAALLDVTEVTVQVRPGAGASTVDRSGPAAAPAGLDRLTASFTEFVGRPDLTLGLGLLALALALVLGALHAFAPGHGKSVMAAYLVAERGSLRHALAVAGTVTLTHTAGVLVLGIVLTTAIRFAPEQIYAWLGVASGLLVAGVGAAMLRRARRGAHPHDHGHDHSHDHSHDHGHDHVHGHDHGHGSGHHHHHHHDGPGRGGRLRSLLAMGFAGGLAPSPSAVVVLLGAIALGRTWFGVLLVIGYGLGMAAALAALGAVLARWRPVLERRVRGRTGRLVPFAAAALVMVVGLSLAVRSVLAV